MNENNEKIVKLITQCLSLTIDILKEVVALQSEHHQSEFEQGGMVPPNDGIVLDLPNGSFLNPGEGTKLFEPILLNIDKEKLKDSIEAMVINYREEPPL